jgi:hypothetical protein
MEPINRSADHGPPLGLYKGHEFLSECGFACGIYSVNCNAGWMWSLNLNDPMSEFAEEL